LPADAAPSLLLVDELPAAGGRLTLAEDESHYLTRVCRARPGDRVSATDGRGALAGVRLIEGGRRALIEVETCERSRREREAWVLAGPPEGERGDWMVEKLAELGVAVFQPLDCERGGWDRMRGRGDRWRRLAIAALRQSRRRFLLEIRPPLPVGEALAGLPGGARRWLADPDGARAARDGTSPAGVSIGLVGPSSGLSEVERATVSGAGFSPICLSDSRLRTETAALAWACWWAALSPGEGRAS
jgi:16S rRNA (uracil1498-N3)-methyltransferase